MSDGNVRVAVSKVYGHGEVTLSEEKFDLLHSQHFEGMARDGYVQSWQVQNGPELVGVFLRNCEQPRLPFEWPFSFLDDAYSNYSAMTWQTRWSSLLSGGGLTQDQDAPFETTEN